jgi:dipeptidyl aminopeptidase/acylaminoacyl peptidase
VRVGETSVPTTFVSPQRLQARIPGPLLAKAGNLVVRVTDAAIGGGTSTVVPLSVVNPPPQLTSVEAPPLQVGGHAPGTVTLTARGRGFRPESVIQLAGTAAPTQYRSDQELAAIIPPELLAKPGELPVVVVTPGPGGGTSHPMSLSVLAPVPPPSPPFPGRFLVFTSNRRGGRNHIYLLDRQTGRLDPLEEANSVNANDAYPSISADGRFIVFQSDRRAGQHHVFLFDRETRSLDPLPDLNHPTAFDGFPHISPDGRFIVFESDRLNARPKVFLFDRQTRTLSELHQANEATADDGLAAISN